MNRFLARLFGPRGRHVAREPKEPPRGRWLYGHGVEDAVYDAGE